jgi:hypothetical protein
MVYVKLNWTDNDSKLSCPFFITYSNSVALQTWCSRNNGFSKMVQQCMPPDKHYSFSTNTLCSASYQEEMINLLHPTPPNLIPPDILRTSIHLHLSVFCFLRFYKLHADLNGQKEEQGWNTFKLYLLFYHNHISLVYNSYYINTPFLFLVSCEWFLATVIFTARRWTWWIIWITWTRCRTTWTIRCNTSASIQVYWVSNCY